MKGRTRRRQLFLFLIPLILPSLAVVAFGLKMLDQERELSEKRAADRRGQIVADVARDTLALVERIRTQEISANPDSEGTPAKPSDPAVALLAWERDGHLALPWDKDPAAARFRNDIADPEFSRRLEAAATDRAQAALIYRAALESARNPSQLAYARFLLAQALEESGMRSEATRQNRELLSLPSSSVDDAGMPFAYYAAKRLLKVSGEQDAVVRRLEMDLDSTVESSPLLCSFLLENLPRTNQSAHQALLERMASINQAVALQQDYPTLRLTPAVWVSYGSEPWLVSVSPQRPENRKLVVAVRAKDIFGAIETQHAVPGLRIVAGTDHGERLGDTLPGLRLSLAGVADTAPQTNLQTFYLLSLLLVLILTIVGGYLLWRDTRRELRLADLRSQFVANVSHELKTPLTSIRMFAEAMQIKGLANDQKRDEYLDTIVNESERLTRLLNNVLDFSRIERGQKQYQMEPVSLSAIVDDAARTMKYPLARQGFDLHLDVSDDIPAVRVDRDALEQAILNLLTNAMKYSGRSREIGLSLARRNGSAIIQVSDHGVGIPKSEQSRIFEKFYRVPSAENKAIAGTGLGLALVSHIAQAHGGAVAVDSAPGEGSTFSISLPLSANNGSSGS
jgi:signal transduction histidine kinase